MGTQSTLESWRRLYAAANQIKKLAPWQWMEETDVFGVQFPDTEEIGYVSIMGMLGEHLAVSVYLGDETFHHFWAIQNAPQGLADAEQIMELPQLMASFEDRKALEKKDRDTIRRLGLRYHGRNAWPMFRSYCPGYYPWFLEEKEIERLVIALEQTVGVAMRFEDDSSVLRKHSDHECLVRAARKGGDGWLWEDKVRRVPDPAPITLTFSVARKHLEEFKRLPRDRRCADVGFFMAPGGVGTPGERPSYTYMLIAVEPESRYILGFELLQALNGLPRMWENLPAKLIQVLTKAGFRPEQLRVTSQRLYQAIAHMCEELSLDISLHDHLPAIEDARESMWDSIAGRM